MAADGQTKTVYYIHQDWVSNEENGSVIPNEVPVPFLCVHLDCKPTWISHSVSTA